MKTIKLLLRIRIDTHDKLKETKPEHLSMTAYINELLIKSLDN